VIEKAHKTWLFGAGDRAHLEMLQAIMFAEAHFFMTLAKWGCPMAFCSNPKRLLRKNRSSCKGILSMPMTCVVDLLLTIIQ